VIWSTSCKRWNDARATVTFCRAPWLGLTRISLSAISATMTRLASEPAADCEQPDGWSPQAPHISLVRRGSRPSAGFLLAIHHRRQVHHRQKKSTIDAVTIPALALWSGRKGDIGHTSGLGYGRSLPLSPRHSVRTTQVWRACGEGTRRAVAALCGPPGRRGGQDAAAVQCRNACNDGAGTSVGPGEVREYCPLDDAGKSLPVGPGAVWRGCVQP
jgi:hypothetical protein